MMQTIETLSHQQTLNLTAWQPSCQKDGLHICKLDRAEYLTVIWPWMRQGLEWLKWKNEPLAHWMPEHVRLEMLKGLAGQSATECFLLHDAATQKLEGFLIAYPLADPFLSGIALWWFVWMAYITPVKWLAVEPDFVTLAKMRGYRGYKWNTSRLGWTRFADRIGARVTEFTFLKEFDLEKD